MKIVKTILISIWLFGCVENTGLYNSSNTIDGLRSLQPGTKEEAVVNELEKPLYVLTSQQARELAARYGKARLLDGDKAWYYASNSENWYFIVFDKNEVVYSGGPVDGNLHRFMPGPEGR